MIVPAAMPGRRRFPAYNPLDEEVPAHGAVEWNVVDQFGNFVLRKPDKDDSNTAFLNTESPIPPKGYGFITRHFPLWAKYNPDDGDPVNGESLGTRAGFWELYRGYEGFLVWGGADGEKVYVQSDLTCRDLKKGGYYSGYYPTPSQPRYPNGCSGCNCCPCICVWATQWHKSLTKDNLLYGPFTSPPQPWTLVSNTLANVGGDPDWMYIGDLASDETTCFMGGLIALDEAGDWISDVNDPAYPIWEGTLTFTNPSPIPPATSPYSINVRYRLSFSIAWDCQTGQAIDTFVWVGTELFDYYTGDGWSQPIFGGWPIASDYQTLPNDIVGGVGTGVCGDFTVTIGHDDIIWLPPLELVAVPIPDCEE